MIGNNFTIVAIASLEDYQYISTDFIASLPNDVKKIIVVTVEGGESKLIGDEKHLKVYQYGYKEFSFAEARNYAKTFTDTEWIISLDLDEMLDFSYKDLMRIDKSADNIGGFLVPIMNFDKRMAISSTHTGLRIFRKRFFWKYRVHEDISDQIVKSGFKLGAAPIVIKHFGYADKNNKNYYDKLVRNYKLAVKDGVDMPADLYVRDNISRITNDMRRWEDDNKG